jgi:hypothetical protein
MDCADADLVERFIGGEQYCSAGHIAESAYCCDHSTVPAIHRRPESSVALPPDFARGIHARSTNVHFIASRGGAASLSQMPVAHGGSAYYLSTFRVRALDPTLHRVQAYPRGAGKRRPDEIRCYRLVAQRPASATHARRQAPKKEVNTRKFLSCLRSTRPPQSPARKHLIGFFR